MTFQVAVAARRTFIIERHGQDYIVVKAFDKGYRMTQADITEAMDRVFATEPDERIVAEQMVSITPTSDGPLIEAESAEIAQATNHAAEHLLRGDQLVDRQ